MLVLLLTNYELIKPPDFAAAVGSAVISKADAPKLLFQTLQTKSRRKSLIRFRMDEPDRLFDACFDFGCQTE